MRAWEENFRKTVPYVPGEQPEGEDLIKLNTNENPYFPPSEVFKAVLSLEVGAFRKYPDPTARALVSRLAMYYGVGEDQVFVGVGSDDVLAMCFLAFFNSKKPILFPDITYSFYPVWADLFHISYECPKLDGEFRIRSEDYEKENGGVIFPNPNAPTGILLPLDEVEHIVKCNQDVIVVIDEAYIDFGGDSALGLIEKYENLLIVQTFSKSRAMAGMRIGFAIGSPSLIKELQDVKFSFNSYTMNAASLAAGAAALLNKAYFQDIANRIIATRERSKKRLRKLGFSFPDSMANFILATHKSVPARELYEALKKQKIYVRYFDKPRLDNYLRISIGEDEEMDILFAFLKKYLGNQR